MWLFVAKFTHQCFGEGVLNQHCLVATKCQLATHTTLSPLWRDLNVQGARPSKKKVWGWDCLETALNQDDIATTNGNTMVSSKKSHQVSCYSCLFCSDKYNWLCHLNHVHDYCRRLICIIVEWDGRDADEELPSHSRGCQCHPTLPPWRAFLHQSCHPTWHDFKLQRHHQDHYHHHQYDQQQQGHDDHGTRSEKKPLQASNSLIWWADSTS